MKHIIISLVFVCLSCICCNTNKKENNFLTLTGKITNSHVDSITLFTWDNYSKTIKINKDGTFSDTLKLPKLDALYLNHDKEQYRIFARNGYEVDLQWDSGNIKKTIKFSGYGSDILQAYKNVNYDKPYFYDDINRFKLNKLEFNSQLDSYITESLNSLPKQDTLFLDYLEDYLGSIKKSELARYDKEQYFDTVLHIGAISPKFNNYQMHPKGTRSLDDYKGKYVYIDVWATWCSPCKREIPFLKKLEEQYHGKNIEFVSISVDENHDKWSKMVIEKELTGTQLITKFSDSFISDYKIGGIPRFILLDPKGKIIDSRAPRPSDPELIVLFHKYIKA